MLRLTFLFTLLSGGVFSQTYWQQEVNYKIQVALNDENHTLSAFESFEYINNSPNALDKIYIHLWPNAYRDGNSALGKQLYQDKNTHLEYASEEDRGNIDSLDFKVNGVKANWQYDPENMDICFITLDKPLQKGEKVTISTPFSVKLPSGKISRLGHIGQTYQITQWYPKPAVYDARGWNPIPYLNQGEFYSEYGSFDVEITLPSNYVVGATGDLQTDSEVSFLNDRAAKTAQAIQDGKNSYDFNPTSGKGFPESSKTKKTIRYTQKNVHDFAWFADKRYNVLKSEVTLPQSKRTVTSWAMYTPDNGSLWKNASEYLNDAIYYYSLWNGDYPYNNVTAVDGTISAGGGMEYPNVTVIGNSSSAMELEIVIVHEVGHNWFYGQLGTNERVHGWMDEGMNTLNEIRYVQTKYPNNTELSDMVLNGRFHFNDLDHHDMADISYRMISTLGEDQPIETHSARFSSINYGIIMYQKTGLVFYYLKDYLGDELFDKSMHAYYEEWEFKHPQPEDMQRSLEKASGKDLNWLFRDLIQTTNHVDYKVGRVKSSESGSDVTVKNVGQVDGPIEVSAYDGNVLLGTQWVEPGANKTKVHFDQSNINHIRIDPSRDIPELNRQNNSWSKDKLFGHLEPIQFEFFVGDNEAEKTNVFWTPMIAGNAYDKFMIGAVVHNYGVPFNKFNYLVAPFFSFGRESVSGIAELSYTMQPKANLKMSRFGLSVKSFKNDNSFGPRDAYFLTIAPYWTAKIGQRKDNKPFGQTIRLQTLYRKDQMGPLSSDRVGAYAEYKFAYSVADHFFELKLRNDFITDVNNSETMGRFTAEAQYKFRYLPKKKLWAEIRGFIGQQYIRDFGASSSYQYSMSLAGTDGRQDLFVDNYFFGRNETSGLWSQFRDNNMGGFKSTSGFGTTSTAMATGNLYVQLPIKTRIFGAFFDAGVYDDGIGLSNVIMNTGLAVRLGDIFGVYFPMWMSDELNTSFGTTNTFDKYGEKIRFVLRLNLINQPINLSNLF